MANYQPTKQEWRGGSDDPRMAAAIAPVPERKSGPIINEILELDNALEHLLKQHFDFSDRLRGAYPDEGPQLTPKTADDIASEPSTGCELKDRLAAIKQKPLYIGRLNNELIGKLWL
mgnify:FL=1